MENLMYVVPVVSVLALLFAGYLAVKVAKQEEGTDCCYPVTDPESDQ